MSHALMSLLTVWMVSAGSPVGMNDYLEDMEKQTSGFIVIDRIDETTLVAETQAGMVELPRDVFPGDEIHEGMVIEWRVNEEEENYRLQEAKARIERLRYQTVVRSDH